MDKHDSLFNVKKENIETAKAAVQAWKNSWTAAKLRATQSTCPQTLF